MCEEHSHLVAIRNLVVLLYEVVDVALWAMVGKMASVAHTRWATRMFVVARVVAGIRRTHDCTRKNSIYLIYYVYFFNDKKQCRSNLPIHDGPPTLIMV